MDLIDKLIDALNDGVTDVQFDRDVLDTNRPEDWGAVELTGGGEEYADGVVIDQVAKADIWVCVSDHGSEIKADVQDVLLAFANENEFTWQFVKRGYLYDLDKVLWQWKGTIWGPLEIEEETTGTETGTETTGTETNGTETAGTETAGTETETGTETVTDG